MNVAAIKSMEDFARTINRLPQEVQDEYFKSLEESLTTEEIETLKKCVAVFKLMTDASFYKATQKALCETLYKEFNKQ